MRCAKKDVIQTLNPEPSAHQCSKHLVHFHPCQAMCVNHGLSQHLYHDSPPSCKPPTVVSALDHVPNLGPWVAHGSKSPGCHSARAPSKCSGSSYGAATALPGHFAPSFTRFGLHLAKIWLFEGCICYMGMVITTDDDQAASPSSVNGCAYMAGKSMS